MTAIAHTIIRNAPAPFDGEIALDYEGRLLRRKRLSFDGGDFMVDLPEVTSLDDGDAFELSDGRQIVVRAAPEPVIEIRGNLARLAWHIGNRHTPCRIEADRLIIRQDHVLEAMLKQLGAAVIRKDIPFRPEGGAYGHGRTFGHDHGPADHAHGHPHGHPHGAGEQAPGHAAAAHSHSHSHAPAHSDSHSHSHSESHASAHSHTHGQSNAHAHSQAPAAHGHADSHSHAHSHAPGHAHSESHALDHSHAPDQGHDDRQRSASAHSEAHGDRLAANGPAGDGHDPADKARHGCGHDHAAHDHA